jgi:hypothetical protein
LAASFLPGPLARAGSGGEGELTGPAPGAALRPLATDRPDVTESPLTVDAGHVQVELDFGNYTHDHSAGVRADEWGVTPFNLRLGLLDNFEAGIFVVPYLHRTERAGAGSSATYTGFGDVTLRGKVNFWGNDGGDSAFGLIADVTLPTGARGLGGGKAAGALTLPVQFDLGHGWDLGAMTVAQFRPDETGGSRMVWLNSATLGHDLGRSFSGYLELTSAAGDGTHVATGDLGVAWKLNPNTQLDLGANFGLTRAADNLLVFTGISRRY